MEKDPSRDPSGTENTLTIISSNGMAKISYLFQVTKERERDFLTRRLILDSKKKLWLDQGGGCHANGGKEEEDKEGRYHDPPESFTGFRAQKRSHMHKGSFCLNKVC
jgi:hypothetical protein